MRTLLLAALVAAPAFAQDAPPPADSPATIAEVLIADGRFTTLVAAAEQAGLTDALAAPGPLTLFAPTDEAFAALGEGTLDELSVDQLRGILLGHVAEGSVPAAAAIEAGSATTLAGHSVAIVGTEDGVMVGNASVIEADVVASNGVVHVVDAVILPPSDG